MTTAAPRLWPHLVALTLLLTALAAVVGTRSSFVTDEAYVQIQLDTIEDTGGWTLDHPLPDVDPEGDAFPLHGATEYEDGFTLYSKHPLLIYLYRPFHAVAGAGGLIALSIAGTVGAAWAAALVAERLRAGSGALTVWLVGVASPLLFDSFVIHAHTIAAATGTLAVLGALRVVEDRRAVWGVACVLAALGTALVRTEGLFLAVALGIVLIAIGLWRRSAGPLVLGALTGLTGPLAVLSDRAWSGAVAGSDLIGNVPSARSGSSYLEARLSSAAYTLVMPGYRGLTLAEALTAVGALLLVLGVVLVLRRPSDEGAILVPIAGAVLLVARAFLEWGPVPGLLIASCVVVAGLLVVDRSRWRTEGMRLVGATCALYAIGVLATQYESGGHTEWGGRYFAVIVPLLAAMAAGGLLDARARTDARRARLLTGVVVGAALGLAMVAVVTVHAAHDRNRERVDGVLAAAAALGPASDGGPPIVVTEDDQIPRLARGRFDDVRFLLVRPGNLERYLGRLADAGFDELLVVSVDPERTGEHLGPYVPSGPALPHPLQWEGGGVLLPVALEAA